MTSSILVTKLFIPLTRQDLVHRSDLVRQLNDGLHHKLTLISAPAGFGKTTLVTTWLDCEKRDGNKDSRDENRIAWLSLDEGDSDPARFLTYIIAALNVAIDAKFALGEETLAIIQSPQLPPEEVILTPLINDIAALADRFLLVLDDYHVIQSALIDNIMTFFLDNMPPNLHLVIISREDPNLPLSRLRVRGHLTELRAADLRFSFSEAAKFLNETMDLDLSSEDIAALEIRTEGWIAGLHLAAISMRGRENAHDLITSFTGSHRLVLDYLIEEVLNQQPQNIQDFLLQTSILDHLSSPLCDEVTCQNNSQDILENLDRANLFLIPLDNERQWYRYHHLFAELLRQRLRQTAATNENEGFSQDELHIRASKWYEANSREVEAFQHAAAANDIERAERLVEGNGVPLTFRGAVTPVLHWFDSLPTAVFEARPSLWITHAMTLLTTGHLPGVEEKLQAAETVLEGMELNDTTRDLIGRIADTRGTMAVALRQEKTLIDQSRRALAYLHPDNMTYRTSTIWKLGVAYEWQGNRIEARKSFAEAASISEASGNLYTQILATTGLGNIQLAENQLHLAVETFQRVLKLVGDLPIPVFTHVHFCLARIYYEWNDLDAAAAHGEKGLQYARPFKDISYIFVERQIFLVRLKLAQGDLAAADAILTEARHSVQQLHFDYQIPEVAAVQVLSALRQGKVESAHKLAQENNIPLSLARVHLAQNDPQAALALLDSYSQEVNAKGWQNVMLKVMVLQAVASHVLGDRDTAVQLLTKTLVQTEPQGFIRTYVDEGEPMARLLIELLNRDIYPEYARHLLAAFQSPVRQPVDPKQPQKAFSEWFEPISERELEVLQLIAEGLSNKEIASRLYLALNTVKAHTRSIYSKLGVNSRTQAVVRARELGLLLPY